MLECVPNISEGRDQGTIARVAAAVRAVPSVHLLHVHSDVDHNRSVVTFASENRAALIEATLALYRVALASIDLRRHEGEHPRVGAVDVCPFVPLHGSTMQECVDIAREVGGHVAAEFGIPVFLYEYAQPLDYRRALPTIRSGGFEKLPTRITEERWKPDFGPAVVHETAGATIIGARVPLIAFNMQLATNEIAIAEKIARSVREISGGLRFVRALPIRLKHRDIVQVSMNLLDYRETPIAAAFELVRQEAARAGVDVLSSEIVGLVPADAMYAVAQSYLGIESFNTSMVLERRLREVLEQDVATNE